jgi:hypothetical protein
MVIVGHGVGVWKLCQRQNWVSEKRSNGQEAMSFKLEMKIHKCGYLNEYIFKLGSWANRTTLDDDTVESSHLCIGSRGQ